MGSHLLCIGYYRDFHLLIICIIYIKFTIQVMDGQMTKITCRRHRGMQTDRGGGPRPSESTMVITEMGDGWMVMQCCHNRVQGIVD